MKTLIVLLIFVTFSPLYSSAEETSTGKSLDKTLDGMGFSRWHPGESPDKLDEMLGNKVVAANKKTSIQECIELKDLKPRGGPDSLQVAVTIVNRCDLMVSFHTIFQPLDAEGVPIGEEQQNAHTQVGGHQEKIELGTVKGDLTQTPSEINVQLVSFDNHAYGSTNKRFSIDAKELHAVLNASKKCFDNVILALRHVVKNKPKESEKPLRSSTLTFPSSETFFLSYRLSGPMPCTQRYQTTLRHSLAASDDNFLILPWQETGVLMFSPDEPVESQGVIPIHSSFDDKAIFILELLEGGRIIKQYRMPLAEVKVLYAP